MTTTNILVMYLVTIGVSPALGIDCGETMLLATQSGPGSTCSASNNLHYWPLLSDTASCHGWAATDFTGRVHLNSANNIRCGTNNRIMMYDQYAGSIECTGSPVSKEYSLDVCTQGIPASLYDKAVDLSCCSNLEVCLRGIPRVDSAATSGESIYLNGQPCTDLNGSSDVSNISTDSNDTPNNSNTSTSEAISSTSLAIAICGGIFASAAVVGIVIYRQQKKFCPKPDIEIPYLAIPPPRMLDSEDQN